MTKTTLTILVILLAALSAHAQTQQSPYVGQESNRIKSLSASEIEAYLNGQGMGLAKAAELNSYPGPRHVLELADQLELSQAQRNQTKKSFDQMHQSATRLGKMIVEYETHLNQLFADSQIDENKLRLLTQRIARLQGDLRNTHLKAHLEMKRILRPSQIAKYDELRGYGKDSKGPDHQHHKHGGQ